MDVVKLIQFMVTEFATLKSNNKRSIIYSILDYSLINMEWSERWEKLYRYVFITWVLEWLDLRANSTIRADFSYQYARHMNLEPYIWVGVGGGTRSSPNAPTHKIRNFDRIWNKHFINRSQDNIHIYIYYSKIIKSWRCYSEFFFFPIAKKRRDSKGTVNKIQIWPRRYPAPAGSGNI